MFLPTIKIHRLIWIFDMDELNLKNIAVMLKNLLFFVTIFSFLFFYLHIYIILTLSSNNIHKRIEFRKNIIKQSDFFAEILQNIYCRNISLQKYYKAI